MPFFLSFFEWETLLYWCVLCPCEKGVNVHVCLCVFVGININWEAGACSGGGMRIGFRSPPHFHPVCFGRLLRLALPPISAGVCVCVCVCVCVIRWHKLKRAD